jgi:hypothetical protein
MVQRRLPRTEPVEPPQRPRLADQPSRFVLLESEVELEYRPQMLEALQTQGQPSGRRGPRYGDRSAEPTPDQRGLTQVDYLRPLPGTLLF